MKTTHLPRRSFSGLAALALCTTSLLAVPPAIDFADRRVDPPATPQVAPPQFDTPATQLAALPVVKLKFTVAPNGVPHAVRVVASCGIARVDQVAVRTVREMRFTAATAAHEETIVVAPQVRS